MAKSRSRTESRIPVDSSGHVPEAALLKRYREFYAEKQDEYDIKAMEAMLSGRKAPPRTNLAKRDYDTTADYVIPLKCTPAQVAVWWDNPTVCDVEDIDTAGAPKVNVPHDMTPEQQKDQGHIKVIATPAEEKKVRRELVMTYTPEELRKFAASHPTIQVKPAGVGHTGMYNPPRKMIELDRDNGVNQGVIAHEGGHHLRHTDTSRKNPIVKESRNICIEESCTVAEQQARSDKPDYNGYYQQVAVFDEKTHRWREPTLSEARKMAEEDHALFTEGRQKGLKDADAIASVQRNWGKSHIARLRYKSEKMAVNIMADEYGCVDRVSMAKPRTKKEQTKVETTVITNANAGRPGVVVAADRKGRGGRTVQTALFNKRR